MARVLWWCLEGWDEVRLGGLRHWVLGDAFWRETAIQRQMRLPSRAIVQVWHMAYMVDFEIRDHKMSFINESKSRRKIDFISIYNTKAIRDEIEPLTGKETVC
jgi:hypothetical protein